MMLKFELPEQMVVIIGKALGAQPHDAVRAVIDELQRQINEQQQSVLQKPNGSVDHDKIITNG